MPLKKLQKSELVSICSSYSKKIAYFFPDRVYILLHSVIALNTVAPLCCWKVK